MFLLAQQLFRGYSILNLIIACIVIGTVLYILNVIVEVPPKFKQVVNAAALAIVGIIAIVILWSFIQ